ncbi:MAG: hypothetical protein IJL63_04570 [Clostridia bacterium]|nr:hypothetical protein [Clostridia bacterium]
MGAALPSAIPFMILFSTAHANASFAKPLILERSLNLSRINSVYSIS